jgi:hypothetical protein
VAPDAVAEPVVAPYVVGGSRLVVGSRADPTEHRPGRAAEGPEADDGDRMVGSTFSGSVGRRPILGGLLNEYEVAA